MEDNIKNKAAFFAQYWGQMVHFHTTTNTHSIVQSLYLTKHCLDNNDFKLLLKHPFKITDKEFLDIGKEIGLVNGRIERCKMNVLLVDDSYKIFITSEGVVSMTSRGDRPFWGDINKIYSLLRAKGFYTGNGLEIGYGWAKLK